MNMREVGVPPPAPLDLHGGPYQINVPAHFRGAVGLVRLKKYGINYGIRVYYQLNNDT